MRSQQTEETDGDQYHGNTETHGEQGIPQKPTETKGEKLKVKLANRDSRRVRETVETARDPG